MATLPYRSGLPLMLMGALAICAMSYPVRNVRAADAASGDIRGVRISAPDSAPKCDPGSQSGLNEEPSIAADPLHPDSLIAAWMDTNGSGVEGAWSSDGGRSWHRVEIPGLTQCSGGGRQAFATRVFDTWITIGPDGTAYLVAKPSAPGGEVSEITVSVSHDDGHTWGDLVQVQSFDGVYNDKPMIVADSARPGYAYVFFNQQEPIIFGPTLTTFGRTTDGGRTWSAPAVIHAFQGEEVSFPMSFADGTLVDLVTDEPVDVRGEDSFVVAGSVPVTALRSTDAGLTWSAPSPVVTYNQVASHIGTTTVGPSVILGHATDGTRGWVVYDEADAGASEPQRIAMVTTQDSGRTWSAPRVIESGGTPFYPMVGASGNHVGVGFYRWEDNDSGASVRVTNLFARVSDDGGQTWVERHLDGPFPEPPGARDYQEGVLVANGVGFVYGRPVLGSTDGIDMFYSAAAFAAPVAAPAIGSGIPPSAHRALPNTGAATGHGPAVAVLLVVAAVGVFCTGRARSTGALLLTAAVMAATLVGPVMAADRPHPGPAVRPLSAGHSTPALPGAHSPGGRAPGLAANPKGGPAATRPHGDPAATKPHGDAAATTPARSQDPPPGGACEVGEIGVPVWGGGGGAGAWPLHCEFTAVAAGGYLGTGTWWLRIIRDGNSIDYHGPIQAPICMTEVIQPGDVVKLDVVYNKTGDLRAGYGVSCPGVGARDARRPA